MVKGYRTGIWMRYLGGDFLTTAASFVERGRPGVAPPTQAIRDFCASFLVPMRYDYLDWEDPLPALTATLGFTRYMAHLVNVHLIGRAFSRRKREIMLR